MYLSFYSLQKEPFHITPDPEFLFLNESHKEALGSLIYGIEKRKGFIAITGGIGLGKTTIVRSYLETKDDGHSKIIYVFNANITFKELLKTVLQELNLEGYDEDVFGMMNRLYLALIQEYEAGNNVVIIIDEAQNMPIETLENLRMLSNLETSSDKLVQIVFVGQQEFDALLNSQELRQLKQRIAIRTSIHPLSRRESHEYINHRLNLAGLREGPLFTLPAMERVVRAAKGVPRTINILCDNALITGFGYEQKPVGLRVVNEVISDFKGRKLRWVKWPYLMGAAVATTLFAAFFFSSYRDSFLKWSHEDFNAKPEVVRIPIKPETNGIESSLRPVKKADSNVILQDEVRPNVKADSERDVTPIVQPNQQQQQAKVTEERPKRKRKRIASPESDEPLSRNTKDGAVADTKQLPDRQEEPNILAKPVDVSKDVDDRLLEMIRHGGPGGAKGASP
jgi:general secretion pathway protein A